MSAEQALDDAMQRRVWGTYTVHLRDGRVTHAVLRETQQPSANPRLAALVQQQRAAQEALASGEDQELVYARLRGGKLVLLAIERHTIRTPNTGENKD